MESHSSLSTEELVKGIIRQHFGVMQVRNNSSLVDDLGAKEHDIVELAMTLEEKLDIQIPDEEMEKLTTVQALIDFVINAQRG
ncbi:hypothetical protein EC957_011004 [Mortierella hygrophila]|uniref:Acyl carrier protein n=1 Tax=Mortierella hygrophila TaxID=979708 RepID=A0A9P6K420_9FUNG|nr:hypothetical protein EC957_011004 [Mortierella hygrophila]